MISTTVRATCESLMKEEEAEAIALEEDKEGEIEEGVDFFFVAEGKGGINLVGEGVSF